MIVDDTPGIRRIMRRAVAEIASVVWEYEDGDEALHAYEAHYPDVVLMDVRMRRMDGLQATRQICACHPLARIVIVTDYDDEALRLAALEAGACSFVQKQNLTGLAEAILAVV